MAGRGSACWGRDGADAVAAARLLMHEIGNALTALCLGAELLRESTSGDLAAVADEMLAEAAALQIIAARMRRLVRAQQPGS